jgi:anti-sigma factor RsiW
MDGQLSDDERQRVEQLLTDDAGARRQLADYREQADLLRQAQPPGGGLRSDFASRVFTAAAAEAESEGLDRQHPLRRAAEYDAWTGSRWPRSAWAAAALALAASVAAIGFFLLPDNRNDVPVGVAQRSPKAAPVEPGRPAAATSAETTADAAEAAESDEASGEDAEAQSVPDPPMGESATARGAANREREGATPSAGDRSAPSPDTSVDSGRAVAEGGSAGAAAASAGQLNFLMVYEVRLTEAGLENNVVGRVFERAGIAQAENRRVSDALVGTLRRADLVGEEDGESEPGSRANILLLEGSAVKLERLMMGFLKAEGEVQSVGFGMLTDPPVTTALKNLSQWVEESEVRQPDRGAALEAQRLVQDEGRVTFTAGEQGFLPLGPGGMRPAAQLPQPRSADADPGRQSTLISQVLLLVRY